MAYDIIRRIYEERIPFHRLLGVRVTEAADGFGKMEFDFRPELVGNYRLRVLHGGVIAAVLDAVGSVAVLSGFTSDDPPSGLGTVDMRTDYLRPARGEHFVATGEVVRPGRSIAVTRLELRNEKNELLAIGTATYRVSTRREGIPRPGRQVTDWLEGPPSGEED